MTINLTEVWQIFLVIFAAGSTYGLIRADLIRVHEKISTINGEITEVKHTAIKAHERMDDHINRLHTGKVTT